MGIFWNNLIVSYYLDIVSYHLQFYLGNKMRVFIGNPRISHPNNMSPKLYLIQEVNRVEKKKENLFLRASHDNLLSVR